MAAPDPERLAVWRSLFTTHSVLSKALTAALEDERGLPLPWFEALNALQRSGGRVRVMDLAQHLVVSPSSLSRQLTRMEEQGLIRRDRGHAGDHRAVVAVLTRDGRDTWRRANTTYLRVAKKLFINRLSDTDVMAMQRALNKVTDA
jgi:DNA-binding MarR family transcriptional regulator